MTAPISDLANEWPRGALARGGQWPEDPSCDHGSGQQATFERGPADVPADDATQEIYRCLRTMMNKWDRCYALFRNGAQAPLTFLIRSAQECITHRGTRHAGSRRAQSAFWTQDRTGKTMGTEDGSSFKSEGKRHA